jgi:hypothetical protein
MLVKVLDVQLIRQLRDAAAPACAAADRGVAFVVFLQAKLRVVPWDGYLKYYNLGEKHPQLIEKRRKVRDARPAGWRPCTCAQHSPTVTSRCVGRLAVEQAGS